MRTRSTRRASALLTVAITALLAVSCGSSGSSSSTPAGTTGGSTAAAGTVASLLSFGGPAECPQRPFCLQGLEGTYGLKFKDVKSLDAGGQLTVAALKDGTIQVGLIFTSSGQIAANNWTLLEDDKKLQPSDNVTPIVNDAIVTAYGADLKKVVDDLGHRRPS